MIRLRIKIYTLISAVFSIITIAIFFIFSSLFSEAIIFYLGIPFALSAFFFFQLLTTKRKQVSFKIKTSVINLILYLLTLMSIVAVLLISPYTGSILEWMKIPLTNWIRFFFSLLLTTFLPGYFSIKILDRENSISGTALIVLSYLLSIFITFLTGYFILLTNNSISLIASQAILAVNLLLALFHYLINIRRKEESITSIDLTQTLLLFSLLLTVAVGSLIVMYHNFPLTPGDMWVHHGQAIQYSEQFPVYESYPYLYHIYLGALFSFSGIPLAITEQTLYILSFMPVLAFYSAVKTWFNGDEDKRIPTITMLLSTLLGFGGIYALHLKLTDPTYSIIPLLRETTSKTYDIYMRFLYLPDIVAPIWNIGLPAFFSVLYFLKKKANNITRALIIPFLVTVSYMGHTSEVIFFVIALFIYAMFFRQKHDPKIGSYVALGLLIVFTLDLAAPIHVYVHTRVGTTLSLPFISSVIVATLACIIEMVKGKHSREDLKKLKMKISISFEDFWGYVRWLLLYSYLFLFVIWLTIVDNFDLWTWGGSTFTPFFVLPTRLGQVGLLVIISIFAYLPNLRKDRNLLFFLSLIPLGFILEQLANYYPSILTYASYRYGTLTFIGGCLIASYGVIKILSSERTNLRFSPTSRKIMVCVLLNALLISGFLTTTLYYTNASVYYAGSELSEDELNALNYIRLHLPRNASVLAFTYQSAQKLRNFAGINAVQDAQRWSKNLLETVNPYIMTYILASSNVRYVYVSEEDSEELKSNNILSSLIEYLPKNFENKIVTIYKSPPLNPPSQQANLGIFHLPRTSPPENASAPFFEEDVIPVLFAASLKTEYSTIYVDKLVEENLPFYLSKYKYVLLNSDPQNPFDDLLEWVANSNTLIVLNSRGYGFFAQLQSLGDFVTEENFGLGKIVYLDIFSAMESNNILEVLRPDFIEEVRMKASILEQYSYRISILPVYNSIFYDTAIHGNLTLKSNITTLTGSITFQDTSISAENEFNDIRILNETTLSINESELTISPLESYLSVKSEAPSITGKIKLGSKSLLVAFHEGGASKQEVRLEGPQLIRFSANRLSINARLPRMNISGTATFDCLDVHSALYMPMANVVQEKANVRGYISFGTMYISKPLIMFSNFQVDGQVSKILDDAPDRSIPLVEAFVSPYNLILILTVCLGAILDAKRRKCASNQNNKKATKTYYGNNLKPPCAESGSLKDYKRQSQENCKE